MTVKAPQGIAILSADAWQDTDTVSVFVGRISGLGGADRPCMGIRTYDGDDFIAIVSPEDIVLFRNKVNEIADALQTGDIEK